MSTYLDPRASPKVVLNVVQESAISSRLVLAALRERGRYSNSEPS